MENLTFDISTANCRAELDLPKIKERYLKSPHRDDKVLKSLGLIEFVAFIFDVDRDAFNTIGFSEKSFLRYVAAKNYYALAFLYSPISINKQIIINYLLD